VQTLSDMRIWSIHPKYLDPKGLVALWREALLAKHVLEGKTKGYKNHPQLTRFKKSKNPLDAINSYLAVIHQEAVCRQYNFDKQKVDWGFSAASLLVTKGQLQYESCHFLNKIKKRDPKKYSALKNLLSFEPHPLFKIIDGEIENWEIVTTPG
jgi:Pyrimidine dimer DNA glycosylase